MVRYPKKDDILAINALATAAYDQKSALLQESNLDFCLSGMEHYAREMGDEERRILRKAAYLFYHLAYDYHAFMDGNKRTALVSCFSFIEWNIERYDSGVFGDEEKALFVRETAEGKKSISAIERWLKRGLP